MWEISLRVPRGREWNPLRSGEDPWWSRLCSSFWWRWWSGSQVFSAYFPSSKLFRCPLPEYDDDLLTMPVSQLRNPAMTDPDDSDVQMGEHINPLQFCSSASTDYTTFVSNGGGACVFSSDTSTGNGIYIADIYDCVTSTSSMSNVKTAMEGVYDLHPATDGICCPNRGWFIII